MRNRALVVLCEGETLCEQWERLLEYEYPEGIVDVIYYPRGGWYGDAVKRESKTLVDYAERAGVDIVFATDGLKTLLVEVAKHVYDRAGYKKARGESSAYAVEDVWTLLFDSNYNGWRLV